MEKGWNVFHSCYKLFLQRHQIMTFETNSRKKILFISVLQKVCHYISNAVEESNGRDNIKNEINEIKMDKISQRTKKSWFFRNIDNTEKMLAKLNKRE